MAHRRRNSGAVPWMGALLSGALPLVSLSSCSKLASLAKGEHEGGAVDTDTCRTSAECKSRGACTLVGGECAPTTDEDCVASEACSVSGMCTLATGRSSNGVALCMTGSNADCERSTECRTYRRCRALVVSKVADRNGNYNPTTMACKPELLKTTAATCRCVS